MLLTLLWILTELVSKVALAGPTVGYEFQSYREGILPNPFHIVNLGYRKGHNLDIELRLNPEHTKVWNLRSRNAYWITKLSKEAIISWGRRDRIWNEADRFWNLSLIQPIDQWDRMRPSQQGLTGVLLDYETSFLEFHVFGSFVRYPENIPNVVIENQRFMPYHPQAISSTPQTIDLLGQATPIGYEIEYPNISEVLFQPSFVGSLESPRKSPFLFRAMYGYKPINYFNYAIRGSLMLGTSNILLKIKPRLAHHHVFALDLGYRDFGNRIKYGLSYLYDHPTETPLSSDYTYAAIRDAQVISPWIQYIGKKYRAGISHLYYKDGLMQDVGPYAIPGQGIVSSHIFFRNATQVRVEGPLDFIDERLSFDGRFVHDFEVQGTWLGGDLRFNHLGWEFYAGFDLVQTQQVSTPYLGAEFLVDMRPLDRIRMGVRYEF